MRSVVGGAHAQVELARTAFVGVALFTLVQGQHFLLLHALGQGVKGIEPALVVLPIGAAMGELVVGLYAQQALLLNGVIEGADKVVEVAQLGRGQTVVQVCL